MRSYRYTLQPYAGPRSRTICPACGKPRCFTAYLDTSTGQRLASKYGRCDREIQCGYHCSPFHGDKKILYHELAAARSRQQRDFSSHGQAIMPTTPLSIPSEVFRASLNRYDGNTLVQLLRQHFDCDVAAQLITQFHLGTAVYWPGACVFWLIDEQGRARGGQVVLYDHTGHTVKHHLADGSTYRYTSWVHTALAQAYRQRGTPIPAWLTEYQCHGQKSPCLFGLPQLVSVHPMQPIALVESAKTAILATPYFPQYCWLATMGLSNLTAERLAPLRKRQVVLFPDAGALHRWQISAERLRSQGFDIIISNYLEHNATPQQVAAGYDLADLLLEQGTGVI